MFKRVEKRRRKKEEEEELGLDEDMKEVLGLHDTDSDESASDSDSDSDSETGEAEAQGDGGGEEEENKEEESENGDEALENPDITVQDAMDDPIYLISLEPDNKACIVCPGKLLKHPKMIEVHKASGAHKRRWTRFLELARQANPDDSAWEVLKRDTKEVEQGSKREQKRKAKLLVIKLKRARIKEAKANHKAKQKEQAAEAKSLIAANGPSSAPARIDAEGPVKKKRRTDPSQEGKSKRKQHQPAPRRPTAISDRSHLSKVKFSAAGHIRGKEKKLGPGSKSRDRPMKRGRQDKEAPWKIIG